MKELFAPVVIVGGSLGGTIAAWSAAKCGNGRKVILLEETDWIGGQLTSQAVPPDEHRWIGEQGCTASYREYRRQVRAYYRNLEGYARKLSNASFVERAPANVVAEEKRRQAEALENKAKVEEALNRIKDL